MKGQLRKRKKSLFLTEIFLRRQTQGHLTASRSDRNGAPEELPYRIKPSCSIGSVALAVKGASRTVQRRAPPTSRRTKECPGGAGRGAGADPASVTSPSSIGNKWTASAPMQRRSMPFMKRKMPDSVPKRAPELADL